MVEIYIMKQKDDKSPVIVFAGTQWEAGFVRTLLIDVEIDAYVNGENLGNLAPLNLGSDMFGAVKVVVAMHDEEKAKQVVADYLKSRETKS